LKDRGKYLVTAWYRGVPYFWSIRGQKLVEDTTTLHVFDITRDLQNVHIPGMTILFRKGTSLVELEYMINVENAEQPQRTVLGDDYTFEMALPDGARDVEATYSRGPEPLPVPTMSLGGGRYGLLVPLTSGRNQIRVTASLPWRDGLEFEVGSNLVVAEWGFMVSPENLDVQAYELEPNDDTPVPGYLRFKGPALDAERTFDIRVNKGVPAGPKEDVFTEEVPDEELSDAAAEAGEDEDEGLPLALQILPIVLIIILLAARRRKAKNAKKAE